MVMTPVAQQAGSQMLVPCRDCGGQPRLFRLDGVNSVRNYSQRENE
jgi:hypothetical protein